MKKAIIFWDYSNFHISINNLSKNSGGIKGFDLTAFAKALQGNDDLVKIYFACSKLKEEKELEGFFKDIDYKPFFYVCVFDRELDRRTNKSQEKQLDVYLATRMVALAYENAYDIAYLISGDEDYVPAIETVQNKGKVVVAVSVSGSFSTVLKRRADKYIIIDDSQSAKFKSYYYENFLKET